MQYYRLSQKCISSGNFQLKFHQKCLLCRQENTHYQFAMEADIIFRYCLFPVWDSAYIQWNVVRNLQQFFQAVGCLSFVTFLLSKLSPNLWNRNRKELQLTPKICNSPPGGAHFTHWWPWSFYTLVTVVILHIGDRGHFTHWCNLLPRQLIRNMGNIVRFCLGNRLYRSIQYLTIL